MSPENQGTLVSMRNHSSPFQVSNNQTVIAATANTLVLVKDLAPKRVGMEALDVPGEAEDALASSIKSSVGGSLGVDEG